MSIGGALAAILNLLNMGGGGGTPVVEPPDKTICLAGTGSLTTALAGTGSLTTALAGTGSLTTVLTGTGGDCD